MLTTKVIKGKDHKGEREHTIVHKITQSCIIYPSDYMGCSIREHGSNLYLY